MSETNRRTFIVTAGGSAAAAAVVPTALATAAQAAPEGGNDTTARQAGAAERLVAWVDDPRSGRVTLMRGEDEVTVHDPELVRLLSRAARS